MGFGRPDTGLDDARQIESSDPDTILIDLAPATGETGPHPFLIFARERAPLRRAHLEVLGC
jgi:hypothetical protein